MLCGLAWSSYFNVKSPITGCVSGMMPEQCVHLKSGLKTQAFLSTCRKGELCCGKTYRFCLTPSSLYYFLPLFFFNFTRKLNPLVSEQQTLSQNETRSLHLQQAVGGIKSCLELNFEIIRFFSLKWSPFNLEWFKFQNFLEHRDVFSMFLCGCCTQAYRKLITKQCVCSIQAKQKKKFICIFST